MKKILITGVNGFIGTHFLEAAIGCEDWMIQGFDRDWSNLAPFSDCERFNFRRGDIFAEDDWLERQVAASDVVIPLAGVARPAFYIAHPLRTFELDFEQNLKIVRMCAKHGARVIFPSTSEVYGICGSEPLDEHTSTLTTGPVSKTRWIYSASKQMMDRLIFALAQEQGLDFTIFRPFNWTGPRLDSEADAEARSARLLTQLIHDALHRGRVTLVGGGEQRRSFTWAGDGAAALVKIVENPGGAASGEIFNIGNPDNNCSVREFAEIVLDELRREPEFAERAQKAVIETEPADSYYGKSYEDTPDRVPSIRNIEEKLGWRPRAGTREIVRRTVAYLAARERATREEREMAEP